MERLARGWLREDVGRGDATTQATLPAGLRARARIFAREECVAAGLEAARAVFHVIDPSVRFRSAVRDGARLGRGATLARIEGPARGILAGERLALNLLQRLSGIATATRVCVDRIRGTGTILLDTRKTTPGLRSLERHAVRMGGGHNHRWGLEERRFLLIKDNHVALAGGVAPALARARTSNRRARLEIEVSSLADAEEALRGGADALLLDNLTPREVRHIVHAVGGRVWIEASGGIRPENLRAYARTGVDAVSMGELTHSVRAIDLSLEFLSP